MTNLKNHPGMFLNDAAAASLERLENDHGVQPITDAGRTEANNPAAELQGGVYCARRMDRYPMICSDAIDILG